MKVPDSLRHRQWSRLVDAALLAVVLAVGLVLGWLAVGLMEVADAMWSIIHDPNPYAPPAWLFWLPLVSLFVVGLWFYIVYRFARWVWPRRIEHGEAD